MSILREVGKDVGSVISTIQNSLTDKKVNVAEGFDILKDSGKLTMAVISNRTELVDALKDGINLEEQSEFKEGFIEGYDIEDNATEKTVEDVFIGAVTLVGALINIFAHEPTTPVITQ